jgi:GntR family transcriptional repressor for pyruvate dehydrogenase complex
MNDKGNVTSRIIAYIKKNIRKGTWQIGEKLPSENELCKLLNVSRVSVRSALQQFVALGILESVHGKGTFLVSNDLSVFGDMDDNANGENRVKTTGSIADMKNLLEFRSMVEPEICSIVTSKATQELIARLTDDLEKMKASVGDSTAFIQADMDFHYALCVATENPVTMEIMADVLKNKKESYQSLNHTVGYYGGIYYHTLLLDAIKRRDTKQAHNLMLEHLKHSIGDLDLEAENGSTGFEEIDGL